MSAKVFRNLLLFVVSSTLVLGAFEDTITFTVTTNEGERFTSTVDNDLTQMGCNSSGKIAMIVHGWLESSATDWVEDLQLNLLKYRGGCIIVMDYSNHSEQEYFVLVRRFSDLSQVLLHKLYQLEAQGFHPDNLFMYGFSFGAQLVVNVGTLYGEQRIAEIDVCDPAGPGFVFSPNIVPMLAAKNVQCIHTSIAKGTMKRNCHQDWLMGRCGRAQEAAGPTPKGSHGLCPHFYNAAFTHDFYATENIFRCNSRRLATNVPELYKMGYMESRKSEVFGDLFSPTSQCYPYNKFTVWSEERGLGRLMRRRQSRRQSQQQKCSEL